MTAGTNKRYLLIKSKTFLSGVLLSRNAKQITKRKKIPAVITFYCVYGYILFENTICCFYIQEPHTLPKVTCSVQFSSLETKANIYNMYIYKIYKCMQNCISWLKFWFYFFPFSFSVCFFFGGGEGGANKCVTFAKLLWHNSLLFS